MEKFSINDWLTLQTRKDITYIRRSLEHESVSYAIFADLFIALFAFALDHLLQTEEQASPSWLWIVAAGLLFAVPVIIFLVSFCKKKKLQADKKMVMPVEDLVDLFDNEICYNVMNADSMRDHMKGSNDSIEKEIQKFYFIEALYYASKASSQLFRFKIQGHNAVQTADSPGGVAYIRFMNVCEIVKKIYEDLIEFATNKDENDYRALLKDGVACINDFIDLTNHIGGATNELSEMKEWKIDLSGIEQGLD